jgi:hypothetical protein
MLFLLEWEGPKSMPVHTSKMSVPKTVREKDISTSKVGLGPSTTKTRRSGSEMASKYEVRRKERRCGGEGERRDDRSLA